MQFLRRLLSDPDRFDLPAIDRVRLGARIERELPRDARVRAAFFLRCRPPRRWVRGGAKPIENHRTGGEPNTEEK